MVDIVQINAPIDEDEIRKLRAGDLVEINGVVVTGRDMAHTFMYNRLIKNKPGCEDQDVYLRLKERLKGSFIYHCGPIVSKEDGHYEIIAAGPTTSIREEPYQAEIIKAFKVKGIIGKGGMGAATLRALCSCGAVYFQAVGGAGVLYASAVEKVIDVYKLSFGMPEAMWVLLLRKFPAVVTMDSQGTSLHAEILELSKNKLEKLIGE